MRRALTLPVLAAAAGGCLTGLAVSHGSSTQVHVTAAADATPILLTSTPAAPSGVTTPAATRPVSTANPKAKQTPKTTTKTKVKTKPKTKAKAKAKRPTAAKPKSGSSFSLGLGPRGPAGPTGAAGPAGAAGPQGPAGPVSDIVRSLTVNWRNGAWPVDPSASTVLPGLGTVTVTCTPQAQTLSVAPAASGPRTVLATDTVQGAGTQGATSFVRSTSQSPSAPITVAIPNNGLILATISVEPYSGDGGSGPDPATLTVSSEWKLNDPVAVNNFCFVAGQIVGKP